MSQSGPGPAKKSRAEQIASLSKATTASLDPENTAKMQQDLNNLITQLQNIRDGFTDAGIALDRVDKAKDPDGQPLNNTGSSFFDQWNALSNQFNDLLNKSCELAGNVGGQCWGFENTVLYFVAHPSSMTTDQLVQLCQNFTKGLEGQKTQVEEFESGFLDLATNVGKLANTINEFATERLKKDQKDLKNLQDAVKDANDKIDSLHKKILIVAGAIGVTLFVVISLMYFCPFFALALAIAGFSAEIALIVEYNKQIAAEQNIIDDDNKKIAELSAEIQLLQQAQQEMDTVKSTNITKINTALKSFSAIWSTAMGDAAAIQGYLTDPEAYGNDPPVVLATYIQQPEGKSLYTSLGDMMVAYAKLQTQDTLSRGIEFKPQPVEKRLSNLVELGMIHPLVHKAVKGVLEKACLLAPL